jgi:WD40 repeat protein
MGRFAESVQLGGGRSSLRIASCVNGSTMVGPIQFDRQQFTAAFSPDGTLIAVPFEFRDKIGRLTLLDSTSGVERWSIDFPGAAKCASFNPNGTQIAVGVWGEGEFGHVLLIDTVAGRTIAKFIADGSHAVIDSLFDNTGERLIAADFDGDVHVWDRSSTKKIAKFQVSDNTTEAIAVNGDSTQIAVAIADGSIRMFDLTSGQPVSPWIAPVTGVHQLSIKDGEICVESIERVVRWRLPPSDKPLHHVDAATAVVQVIAANDGTAAIVRSQESLGEGHIVQWVRTDGPSVVHQRDIEFLTTNLENDLIIGVGRDGVANVFAWNADEVRSGIPLHVRPLDAIAAATDHFVLISDRERIRLYDPKTNSVIKDRIPELTAIVDVAFTPDGRRIAVCRRAEREAVCIYDIASGRRLAQLKEPLGLYPHSPGFTADGKRLIFTDAQKGPLVMDTDTGLVVSRPKAHSHWSVTAEMSRDRQFYATSSEDGTLAVRHSASGDLALPMLQLDGRTMNVSFSGDGRLLAYSTETGTYVVGLDSGLQVAPLEPLGIEGLLAFAIKTQVLWTASPRNGSILRMDLEPDPRPTTQLVAEARELSHKQIDTTGGLSVVDEE